MKRIVINTLYAFLTIEAIGLLLGSVIFASTEPLIAKTQTPMQVVRFIPFGCIAGAVVTAIPTAIYSMILAVLFSYAPKRLLCATALIPISIAMTTVCFLICLKIMREPFSGLGILLLPSIAAGIAGVIVLMRNNTGQQAGPAYPPQGVGSADP